jgi:tRNA A-37 threonylcarbamoyl transferase component Bud32
MSTRDFKRKNIKAAFCQGFCEHKEADFLSWLDHVEAHGHVLKDDKKAILIRSQYDGKDLVIKHYKYIGVPYALIHAFTKSRAQHSWQASLKLASMNIPTPRALACVEQVSCGIVKQSYFIYEFEDGFHLGVYAWFTPVERFFEKPYYHQVLKTIMASLKKHRISHGDLKMPNILMTSRGPVLIDLDQVRFHWFKPTFAPRYLKDLLRFRRDLPWNRSASD